MIRWFLTGRRAMTVNPKVREAVYRRDHLRCRYCGCSCSIAPSYRPPHGCDATLDHVVPQSKGGRSHIGNLVTACSRCNHAKGDGKWPGLPKAWPPVERRRPGEVRALARQIVAGSYDAPL